MRDQLLVERALLPQVVMGIGGQKLPVDNDVYHVVERLQEIDPNLFVNYIDPPGGDGYFTIVELCRDGVERLVTTVQELTPDVVEHIRMIGSESYDAVAEMEKADDEATRNKRYEFAEKVGEIGERLHHALRKDFGYDKARVAVSKLWTPGGTGA